MTYDNSTAEPGTGSCCSCGGTLGEPETAFDPEASPTAWHDCYHCLGSGWCWCEETGRPLGMVLER